MIPRSKDGSQLAVDEGLPWRTNESLWNIKHCIERAKEARLCVGIMMIVGKKRKDFAPSPKANK